MAPIGFNPSCGHLSSYLEVETINYPIWNVAFPAMTICNVNKVQKSRTVKIKNMLLANKVPEDVAMKFFTSLANLVVFQRLSDNFTEIFKILNNNGYTTEKLMLELMQPCSELLKRCSWMGTNIKCMDLFKTVKTDEGFCCSFNYYHSNETFESPDTNKDSKFKNRILHVAGAGIHTGMSVVLDVQEDEYVSATRIIPSALVHIHDALDYAEMKILALLVEKGELVQMPIDPSVIDTTNDVKSLHHSKRNCIQEVFLYPTHHAVSRTGSQLSLGQSLICRGPVVASFSLPDTLALTNSIVSLTVGAYGYENCIIECRMNAILDKCGCIPFYYNVKYYKSWSIEATYLVVVTEGTIVRTLRAKSHSKERGTWKEELPVYCIRDYP
ncbi:pickpocket protein 28-like [Arctopsyche grandis]|uniref:pickpocket protein 28-like n=1 Tax=Arctopsyche grandis TaxID=121162 RepID=UPI00406D7D5E